MNPTHNWDELYYSFQLEVFTTFESFNWLFHKKHCPQIDCFCVLKNLTDPNTTTGIARPITTLNNYTSSSPYLIKKQIKFKGEEYTYFAIKGNSEDKILFSQPRKITDPQKNKNTCVPHCFRFSETYKASEISNFVEIANKQFKLLAIKNNDSEIKGLLLELYKKYNPNEQNDFMELMQSIYNQELNEKQIKSQSENPEENE